MSDYAYEPFANILLERQREIQKLLDVSKFALAQMNGSVRLRQAMRLPQAEIDRVKPLENEAIREVQADFPLLNGAAAVLLWGSLESAIRDFLVRWLVIYPEARQVKKVLDLRVRFGEIDGLGDEDRVRYIIGIMEREVGAALKPGIGRFKAMLTPFNLHPPMTKENSNKLLELAVIRNVMVHRAGIADQRLVHLCPWLPFDVGEPVCISSRRLASYLSLAHSYAADIVEHASKQAEAFASR